MCAELDGLAERRRSLLPLLFKLRNMARAGRKVRLPLVDREIPLVADEWAKPELGSGSVKITPAHDPNDYDVARRQNLPMINILNFDGTLNANAGPYVGLKILPARQRVVADLEALGLVEKVEDREIELAHSDRSKTPIEPFLADQWFVKMDQLAQSAMDAVTSGRVKIVPAALRPRISRLAQRKARLARQPPTVVGTPDSDLVRADRQRGRSAAARSRVATTWSGTATPNKISGSSVRRKSTWPKTPSPATS